jgi:hypothetical protein
MNSRLDGGIRTCNQCHAVPTGTNGEITPAGPMNASQSMKVAQLRSAYEKVGFTRAAGATGTRGFGLTHDGSSPTLVDFLQNAVFIFQPGATGAQQRRDVASFVLAFPGDTHAGVGKQLTLDAPASGPDLDLLNTMFAEADAGDVGLVANGVIDGQRRGLAYVGGNLFQTDRAAQTISRDALLAAAAPGAELTLTMVVNGTQTRIGVDRDDDGSYDGDERAACGDEADPAIAPRDIDFNGRVDNGDLQTVLTAWSTSEGDPDYSAAADLDNDGDVDVFDLNAILQSWSESCVN